MAPAGPGSGRGAEALGFEGNVWTTKKIATVIRRQFGIRHHPAHVSRLVRQLGWSPQRPLRRATQRNEAAVTAFREEQWPSRGVKPRRKTGPSSSSMKPASINSRL